MLTRFLLPQASEMSRIHNKRAACSLWGGYASRRRPDPLLAPQEGARDFSPDLGADLLPGPSEESCGDGNQDRGNQDLGQEDQPETVNVSGDIGHGEPQKGSDDANDDRDEAADRLHAGHEDAGDQTNDDAGTQAAENARGIHGATQAGAPPGEQGHSPGRWRGNISCDSPLGAFPG
jgi:hypothetical protein